MVISNTLALCFMSLAQKALTINAILNIYNIWMIVTYVIAPYPYKKKHTNAPKSMKPMLTLYLVFFFQTSCQNEKIEIKKEYNVAIILFKVKILPNFGARNEIFCATFGLWFLSGNIFLTSFFFYVNML